MLQYCSYARSKNKNIVIIFLKKRLLKKYGRNREDITRKYVVELNIFTWPRIVSIWGHSPELSNPVGWLCQAIIDVQYIKREACIICMII
jgi:hypothetical protein